MCNTCVQVVISAFVLLLLLLLMSAETIRASVGVSGGSLCVDKERQALLKIKRELLDPYGRLSSWGTTGDHPHDCCKWEGVQCDNKTGHVLMLDLSGPSVYRMLSGSYVALKPLGGNISTSLLELTHLTYLDLSANSFQGNPFPEFLSSLRKLRHLGLSLTNLTGKIPSQLGNLSKLEFLDLSQSRFLYSQNLDWLSHLHSLRHLDLSAFDLSQVNNQLLQLLLTKLPFLQTLLLRQCNLHGTQQPTFSVMSSYNASVSLATLDLSFNDLTSTSTYTWLFNFSKSLTYIDLSNNQLEGEIPYAFGEMTSLVHLDISSNLHHGGIPASFGNFTRLETLLLGYNSPGLSGQLSEVMENLTGSTGKTLKNLDLSGNEFTGLFPDVSRFTSLNNLALGDNKLNGFMSEGYKRQNNLTTLDITSNQLSGSLPSFENFPFLQFLLLDENQLNGTLNESIGRLSQLTGLFLSWNNLEGAISDAHFSNLSQLQFLDLSFNSLLTLNMSSAWVPPFQLIGFWVSFIKLGPHFPGWLQTQHEISDVDMSGTEISDPIPGWFWDISPSITHLNLSHNHIHGPLPDLSSNSLSIQSLDLSSNNFTGSIFALCNMSLQSSIVDLSNNLFSGEFPDCFTNWAQLQFLNLANNNLSGKIMHPVAPPLSIRALHLRNNNFIGQVSFLKNCTNLAVIDLGGNKFSGELPAWIGDSFPNLVFLSTRSNRFHGAIPLELCLLNNIKIIDMSLNKVSGAIPECLHNLTAMTQEGSSTLVLPQYSNPSHYRAGPLIRTQQRASYDSAFVVWKGIESEYKSTAGLVKMIDLSSNNITGEIPPAISTLVGLLGLNLSRNSIGGSIPPSIGHLRQLNFLDLSRNHLSGKIPPSLSQLSHLGVLNLSSNHLSGRIPLSPHLDTFDDSSYLGNPGLCGSPLPIACPGDPVPPRKEPINKSNNQVNEEDELISKEFFISLAIGFIIGFWGVCGTLVIKTSWRHKFFMRLSDVQDWMYVMVVRNKNRLKQQCQKW